MVVILKKGKHNTDFHPMVDFIEESLLRIETTEEGTKILATVDGIFRTVSESSLRRNFKLRDEEGISSLLDAELFENLTLMGYNISPNQKFTFQKGQFSHQWKYLIHTIMQCLSPKSTRFNKFSSNIATALICLATNRTYIFSKMIFDGLVKNVNNKDCSPFDTMLLQQDKGLGTPTEPHHTPSQEAQPSSHSHISSSLLPPVTTTSIPTVTSTKTTRIKEYTRRPGLLSPLATIDMSSTLPHDSAPRVTSPAAVEGMEAKFNSVWKQMEDFIPMGSKEEAKRIKRKGINLEQESAKKQKSSEEITEEAKSPKEVTKEKVKEMMHLVPIKEVYVESLQVKHPIINWKGRLKSTMETGEGDSQQQTTFNQRQRNLYACGEGLPSEEGSSTCDDLLQTSSRELLTYGK
nr:synaptobrevin, longin-like domain protein [Tanacetum cinerariifolium]